MGFLSKIKNKMRKRVSRMPRGNMGSDFRMPQKRGGGFGNLREVIRRLKEQQGMRPQPISDRMPDQETLDKFRQMASRPNPFVRSNAPSFNPTIFGQPIPQGADFSNMPNFSQIDMSQLDLSGIPQSISQMDLPQMPEGLPSMQDVQGMPQMGMNDMQPRMMMARGDVAEKETLMDFLTKDRRGRKPGNAFSLGKDIYDFANQPEPSTQMSPEQEIFSLQTQLENLQEQLRMDRSYNDDQAVINTSAEMAAIQRRMQEILQESGRTISIEDSQMGFKAAGSIGLDDQGNPVFPEYAGGGYVNGYAEGDEVMMEGNEIESMLSGMDSGEEEAMGELEQMAPEMEMIDQLVMMVAQMIQQGAGEEEVIGFLREQGLDDEDIGTVLQLVAEMSETEEMAEDQIGNELAQLG